MKWSFVSLSLCRRVLIPRIIEFTPKSLRKEIVLYEDASEEEHVLTKHLEKFAKLKGLEDKLIIQRSEYRQGLIRAKVHASRLATGEVIVFMDSHCEVAERWLEPLLQPIKEDPKSISLPVVDLINPVSFDYSSSMVAKSGFDWGLTFKWIYLPWEYFETPENNVKPFNSPAMPGGLLAMKREYFMLTSFTITKSSSHNIRKIMRVREVWGRVHHIKQFKMGRRNKAKLEKKIPSVKTLKTEKTEEEKFSVPTEKVELVKILRRTSNQPEGPFRGTIATVEYLLALTDSIVFNLHGLEIFSSYAVHLLKSNNPFPPGRAVVSISLEGRDKSGSVGTRFKPIDDVTTKTIIQCVNESDVEINLESVQFTIRFTYLNPPASS